MGGALAVVVVMVVAFVLMGVVVDMVMAMLVIMVVVVFPIVMMMVMPLPVLMPLDGGLALTATAYRTHHSTSNSLIRNSSPPETCSACPPQRGQGS